MMKENKGKKVFQSKSEFRNAYFPQSAPKPTLETPEEAKAFGAKIAIESLRKVQLNMKHKSVSS